MNTLLRLTVSMVSALLAPAAFAALGTSAALDQKGHLWIAYAEEQSGGSALRVSRLDDGKREWRSIAAVNATPEPVSADGENRPKLAFGPLGEMYVTWTSPTSAKYTADIRFARSLDAGKSWSAPVTVHRDRQRIAHRFESLLVDREGRIWITWIDKRDLHLAEKSERPYAGAAIYYAYSEDRGTSWRGDFKLADNSCECCRVALTLNAQGRPAAMWRHVFGTNERDHAFAELTPERKANAKRVTFDRWSIDACPHHGPGLAIAGDAIRHAVWFTMINGQGRVFYGQLSDEQPKHARELPSGASHADIAVNSSSVAIAWKRFDGTATRVETWVSQDGGRTFAEGAVLSTRGKSDQPRLASSERGIFLVWRQEHQTSAIELTKRNIKPTPVTSLPAEKLHSSSAKVRPFSATTLEAIEREHRGETFWLILWDLECTYCLKSMQHAAEAQTRRPDLNIVTVATDPVSASVSLQDRLAHLGLRSEAYAFANAPAEALRHAIDPEWAGEKPRAYHYSAGGERESYSGVLPVEQLLQP
jgi:hypothetical protein